jgi:hypothetical protein
LVRYKSKLKDKRNPEENKAKDPNPKRDKRKIRSCPEKR